MHQANDCSILPGPRCIYISTVMKMVDFTLEPPSWVFWISTWVNQLTQVDIESCVFDAKMQGVIDELYLQSFF